MYLLHPKIHFNKPSAKQAEGSNTKSLESINLHLERTIKIVGKVEADGIQTSEGFVVLCGSYISFVDDTIPAVIKERYKKAPVDGNGIIQEDMFFSSPSYATMFVIGKSANGLTSRKTASCLHFLSLRIWIVTL